MVNSTQFYSPPHPRPPLQSLYSWPSLGQQLQSWKLLRAAAAPTWPSHAQQEGDPLPALPSWACPSPIAASCHTARSRFPLVLPAPFRPYTHPLEHSPQFSACMSHHPQSSTLQTPHSAEPKGFLRFHSFLGQWPYLLPASFTVCRLAMKCWLSQSRGFCALLFLLNSSCLAQRTQSKHAENCAKHTYAWMENWVDGWVSDA